MSNKSACVGMPLVDGLSWEYLLISGQQSLRRLEFESAIKSFVAANVHARESQDEFQLEASRQWLGGAMKELCRVSLNAHSMVRAMQIADAAPGAHNRELMIEIMLDVCSEYEWRGNAFLAEALYSELLKRAKMCPASSADELCRRIQKRLLASRRISAANVLPGAKDK